MPEVTIPDPSTLATPGSVAEPKRKRAKRSKPPAPVAASKPKRVREKPVRTLERVVSEFGAAYVPALKILSDSDPGFKARLRAELDTTRLLAVACEREERARQVYEAAKRDADGMRAEAAKPCVNRARLDRLARSIAEESGDLPDNERDAEDKAPHENAE